MKLYKYRVDLKDPGYSNNIYALDFESSLQKWIEHVQKPETNVLDKETTAAVRTELAMNKAKQFSFLEGSKATYCLPIISGSKHHIIYVDEIIITPDFIADLKYFATDQGGRRGYAASGYRPHVKFTFSENLTSGEQIFWDKDIVYPGEFVRAQIRILDHITFRHKLSSGMQFEFAEGAHLIGTGTIVEVINPELKR